MWFVLVGPVRPRCHIPGPIPCRLAWCCLHGVGLRAGRFVGGKSNVAVRLSTGVVGGLHRIDRRQLGLFRRSPFLLVGIVVRGLGVLGSRTAHGQQQDGQQQCDQTGRHDGRPSVRGVRVHRSGRRHATLIGCIPSSPPD